MRPLVLKLGGLLAAFLMVCWRATLRFRVEDDPRPTLRAAGRHYIYAILHAQQLSFILLSDDVRSSRWYPDRETATGSGVVVRGR